MSCRYWKLVESSISDDMIEPLNIDWINNVLSLVPPHLLEHRNARLEFLKVGILYSTKYCLIYAGNKIGV